MNSGRSATATLSAVAAMPGTITSRRSLLDEKENNFFDRLDNFQFCRP